MLAYALRGSNDVFALRTDSGSLVDYWLELVMFALYFYFNFSGYSDVAIGVGPDLRLPA